MVDIATIVTQLNLGQEQESLLALTYYELYIQGGYEYNMRNDNSNTKRGYYIQ